MKTEEILKQSKIENGILKLPQIQIERKDYLDFAKDINFLGGKWKGGKTQGFAFDRPINDIAELLNCNENKKDLQFFGTPSELAAELVELCEIDNYHKILEPSAGRGAIITEIQKVSSCSVHYFEKSEVGQKYLDEFANIVKLGNDFLEADPKPENHGQFERIVANPPFSKNQDVDHILKMYDMLDNGGKLVSVSSTHWERGQEKKCQNFRKFLEYTKADIFPVPAETFKESGTNIESRIILISK